MLLFLCKCSQSSKCFGAMYMYNCSFVTKLLLLKWNNTEEQFY